MLIQPILNCLEQNNITTVYPGMTQIAMIFQLSVLSFELYSFDLRRPTSDLCYGELAG